MVSKELKKLSRRELIDIIYQLKKNEQLLQDEISALQEALQDKRLHLSTAGSIADAALSISNVFTSVQSAADLYLQEITHMKEAMQTECENMLAEAQQKSEEILAEAQQKSEEMIAASEEQCATLNTQYQRDCAKWYKLRQDIRSLEEQNNQPSSED